MEALFCDVPIHDVVIARLRRTSAVVNTSVMKAVPIVSNTPRMIPNRRFIAATIPIGVKTPCFANS